MSCPHAETTTILWIYGEAGDAHEAHVASCDTCQQVLAMHEDVTFHLSAASSVATSVVNPPVIPKPANSTWMGMFVAVVGVGVAAAAAVMFAIGVPLMNGSAPVETEIASTTEDTDTIVKQPQIPEDVVEVASADEIVQVAEVVKTTKHWDFDGFLDDWDDPFEGIEDEFAALEDGLRNF